MNSPELQTTEPTEKEKRAAQYENASTLVMKEFNEYHEENRKETIAELKRLQADPSNAKPEEIDMLLDMAVQDFPDESEYLYFTTHPSFAKPQKGMSWEALVKESNSVNSAKKTVSESTISKPQIYNLLLNNVNAQKVATHLDEKFGSLRLTDRVSVSFNDKTEKTEITFTREGEDDYTIPFREIN